MKNQQSGFTLIELIVVIVILGILAAVAVPRFIDLSEEAEKSALDAVAGSMGSAMALNYAGCSISTDVNKCAKIENCNEVGTILQGGAPAGYTVGSVDLTTAGNGTTATCTVTHDSSTKTQTFGGIGAGQ